MFRNWYVYANHERVFNFYMCTVRCVLIVAALLVHDLSFAFIAVNAMT